MWTFSVGLYLVAIQVNSLRLAAIYGLCLGLSSLMFGALIGEWIDRNPRLAVVRISLLIQNSTIIVCAVILGLLLFLGSDIHAIWNGGLTYLLQGLVIMFGCFANLASIANKISIQKDWVVVVSGSDKGKLANINATIRRIDLVINIVAPIVVGQIMTFASMFAGTVFIASWNLVSGFVEYYLLLVVYNRVPALAVKQNKTCSDKVEMEFENGDSDDIVGKPECGNDNDGTGPHDKKDEEKNVKKEKSPNQIFSAFIVLVKGWKIYMSYQVHFAGLGLAFLYMTVLSCGAISIGYAYSQGVPEWIIGIFQGAGSISGVLGTVLYPFLRKRVGLERTGLWAITEEMSSLVLCVICIWTPGSPFSLSDAASNFDNDTSSVTMVTAISALTIKVPSAENNSFIFPLEDQEQHVMNYKTLTENDWTLAIVSNTSQSITSTIAPNAGDPSDAPESYISIAFFFTGIVCARLGLWCFDLVVTQLFQENVMETQRGVVNGVQNSLNSLMEILQFTLVIILPKPETFGILIMLSFIFVSAGGVLYTVYCYKVRGHIIPFHNIETCKKETLNTTDNIENDVT
ncbi:ferroportin-like isoform X2 [Glandiceps talaboti]